MFAGNTRPPSSRTGVPTLLWPSFPRTSLWPPAAPSPQPRLHRYLASLSVVLVTLALLFATPAAAPIEGTQFHSAAIANIPFRFGVPSHDLRAHRYVANDKGRRRSLGLAHRRPLTGDAQTADALGESAPTLPANEMRAMAANPTLLLGVWAWATGAALLLVAVSRPSLGGRLQRQGWWVAAATAGEQVDVRRPPTVKRTSLLTVSIWQSSLTCALRWSSACPLPRCMGMPQS